MLVSAITGKVSASGARQTGTRCILESTSVWRIGPEISKLRRRPLSGLGGASKLLTDDVGDKLPGSLDFLPSPISLDLSLESPDLAFGSVCSGDEGASEPASESSIRQTTASGFGGATTDHVGVITVDTGRLELDGDIVVMATAPLVISAAVADAGDVEPLVVGW